MPQILFTRQLLHNNEKNYATVRELLLQTYKEPV